MDPIDFGGHRSKFKVTIDMYGNNFVNTLETKPLCASSSNLADMLTIMRWWTLLILEVTGQRWRSWRASSTNVGCVGMLRFALLYLSLLCTDVSLVSSYTTFSLCYAPRSLVWSQEGCQYWALLMHYKPTNCLFDEQLCKLHKLRGEKLGYLDDRICILYQKYMIELGHCGLHLVNQLLNLV